MEGWFGRDTIVVLLEKIESPKLRNQYAAAAAQVWLVAQRLSNMKMNKTIERSGTARMPNALTAIN